MHREIVISIINFRTADLTIGCAQSVLDELGDIDAEIVIVDNQSGDGSAEMIDTWIGRLPDDAPVRLIRSATNSGFSGGHNQGVAAVAADYYLILNSDAVLHPGFFAAIRATARAHPEAGFIAPRLEGEDGHAQVSCFRFHSPMSEFIRGANSGPVTKLLKRWEVPLGLNPAQDAIDWASFACILVNARMMQEIGPMDEGYFLYFEDAEYCLRARRAGWRIHHAPDAVAVHFRGGSGPVKSLARARKRLPSYFYSSRSRFLYQAHGLAGLWSANLLWTAGRGIAGLRQLAGRREFALREREGCDIWTNALNPLGPRYAPGD